MLLSYSFAYIEFASEAIAEKHYKSLQGAKIKDAEIFVDYVGEKSKKAPPSSKKESGWCSTVYIIIS
jgi:hypothetical protein